MATSKGPNKKIQVAESLLRNHEKLINHFFQKHRTFVEGNSQFRKHFFGYLKAEIINSLNMEEKILLLDEIQRNLYSNQTNVYPINDSPNYEMGGTSYPMDNFVQYPCYSNDYIFDFPGNQYDNTIHYNSVNTARGKNNDDSFETWNSNEDTGISRSTEPRAEELLEISNLDSLPNSSISVSIEGVPNSDDELPPSTDDFENANNNIAVIKELFNIITEMIRNHEKISKKLQNIRNAHGRLIYQQVLNYVPKSDTNVPYKKEPIIFQLALNIDKYELVLDQIYRDNLLNLNLRNQFKMSIYNVLLFTNLDSLCKFLVYIKNKNIKSNIKFIYSTTEEIAHLCSAQTDRFKNLSISTGSEGSSICQSIINGKTKVKDSYLKRLAQDFSGVLNQIDTIYKVDSNIIVKSSFLVFLGEININNLLTFLEFLILVLKESRLSLCKYFQIENHEGKTVVSIIEKNSKSEFQKSAKFIKEFIDKYKDPKQDDNMAAKKK